MKRITDETRASATHVEASPRVIDRGIDVRGVLYTVIGIVALVVVAALAMWWVLAAFLSGAEAADPRPAPAVAAVPRELPPGPRLQASPEAELARIRAREELILSSYGRTADGRVRIPIERAMEALAARGETPIQAPSAFDAGQPGPTDPNADAGTVGTAAGDDAPPGGPAQAAGDEGE